MTAFTFGYSFFSFCAFFFFSSKIEVVHILVVFPQQMEAILLRVCKSIETRKKMQTKIIVLPEPFFFFSVVGAPATYTPGTKYTMTLGGSSLLDGFFIWSETASGTL